MALELKKETRAREKAFSHRSGESPGTTGAGGTSCPRLPLHLLLHLGRRTSALEFLSILCVRAQYSASPKVREGGNSQSGCAQFKGKTLLPENHCSRVRRGRTLGIFASGRQADTGTDHHHFLTLEQVYEPRLEAETMQGSETLEKSTCQPGGMGAFQLPLTPSV